MQNVLKSISAARQKIKSKQLKKDGENSYSNYKYFSPEFVSSLVSEVCGETGIVCLFSLKADEFGYYGEILTIHIDSGESMTTTMRTAKPAITATNETQQMGGMYTYTKRYSLMSLFDIDENEADPDSQDNRKQKDFGGNNQLPWLNKGSKEYTGAVEKLKLGQSSIAALKKYFKISKSMEQELTSLLPSN